MSHGAIVGACGDFITLLGGAFLAWDAIHGESTRDIEVALNEPQLRGKPVILRGRRIELPEQAEDLFVHAASRNAKIGFGLLVFGFVVLFASRIIDLFL